MNNNSEPCILDDELKVLDKIFLIDNVSRMFHGKHRKAYFSFHLLFTPIILRLLLAFIHLPSPSFFQIIFQSLRRRKLFADDLPK